MQAVYRRSSENEKLQPYCTTGLGRPLNRLFNACCYPSSVPVHLGAMHFGRGIRGPVAVVELRPIQVPPQ